MKDPAAGELWAALGETDVDALCLRNLLGGHTGVYFFKDADGRFIRASRDCAALTGRTPAEMVGLTDFDLTDAAHASELAADERRILDTGQDLLDKEEVDRLADQPGTWVETSKFPLRDPNGTIIGTFGYSRDVSRWERVEAELTIANARLRELEGQTRAILDTSTDGIAMYDPDLRYRFLNPTGEELRGRSFSELEGRTDREVGIPEVTADLWEETLRRVLTSGIREELEVPGLPGLGGEGNWYHIVLTPVLDANGSAVGVLTVGRDISALKRAEAALGHQARHDPLTGLANRVLMSDRLARAITRLDRRPGAVAVFYIDLDNFKEVNDRFGHAGGDTVIVEASRRLVQAARRQDTVARLGGDEFAVVCEVDHATDAEPLARRIVDMLTGQAFAIDGEPVGLSGSVGCAITESADSNPDDILRNADHAMYEAKRAGRNRYFLAEASAPSAGR